MQAQIDVPKNVIWLKQMAGRWHSISHADEFKLDLFGTNELPTPFKADEPAEKVHSYIQQRNPDMFVMVVA